MIPPKKVVASQTIIPLFPNGRLMPLNAINTIDPWNAIEREVEIGANVYPVPVL